MVHEQHRRPVGRARELGIEPGEAPCAQLAALLAGNHRVEADQPQRVVVERVMQELAVLRQVPVVGKGPAQRVALVVVAGNRMERHGERREDLAQQAAGRDRDGQRFHRSPLARPFAARARRSTTSSSSTCPNSR
jgi:hypothetical protein